MKVVATKSGETAPDQATNDSAHRPRPNECPRRTERAKRRERHHARRENLAGKLVQFSSGLSRPFIQRPVMTMLLTVSIIVFGILTYKQLAVNDLPAVDYPVIQVQASYPGANPETMANTIATPLERQFMQIPGLDSDDQLEHQGNTTSRSSSTSTRASTPPRPTCRPRSSAPPAVAGRPAEPADVHQDQSERSADHVHRADQRHGDRGELYDYANAGAAADQHPAGRIAGERSTASRARFASRPIPATLARGNMTIDDLSAAIRNGTTYSGAGQFDGTNKSLTAPAPTASSTTREGYRNLIVSTARTARRFICATSPRCVDGVQDERLVAALLRPRLQPARRRSWCCAVSARPAPTRWRSRARFAILLPQIQRRVAGFDSISSRSTIARKRSSHSLHDVQETLAIAFVLVVLVIFVFLGRATDTLIPSSRCRCRC